MIEDNIIPIQIIGTQRSGSNLLRLMLNQLTEVAAPHPPHILKTFVPLLDLYGDLAMDDNFVRLVKDVCDFVKLNPVRWTGFTPDCQLIFERTQSARNIFSIFQSIYSSYALSKGSRFWCCKSLANVHYAHEMHAEGIRPYYIYLYRDGRDVALSFKKIMVGEKHTYYQAVQWKNDQEQSLKIAGDLGPDRVIPVAYEDLIAHPKTVLSRICSFLGISFRPQVLEYFKSQDSHETARSGEMWQNVTRPVISNNTQKYLKELSAEDVLIFESVAGDILTQLGYALCTQPEQLLSGFSPEDLRNFGWENQFMKKRARTLSDDHDKRQRMPQEALIREIQALMKAYC